MSPVHTAETESSESRRGKLMGKLRKAADLLARNADLNEGHLSLLETGLDAFFRVYEDSRNSAREAKWARFEANQPKNMLRTVHQLGLQKKFIDTVVYSHFGACTANCGHVDDSPESRRKHVLAGDLVMISREEIMRKYANISALSMKEAVSALEKYGLRLGAPPLDWIPYEKRMLF